MPDGESAVKQPLYKEGIVRTIDSPITYRAEILGPEGLDFDLSLKYLCSQEAADANPQLARAIVDFVGSHGGKRIFAPRLNFTRNIARTEQFDIIIRLPGGMLLYRTSLYSDACSLPQAGDVMLASVGGCSIFTMVCGEEMRAGHAGLKSLFDQNYVLNKEGGDPTSIVDTAARSVCDGDFKRLRKASCKAYFSLPCKEHAFNHDHPEFGKHNKMLKDLVHARHPKQAGSIIRPFRNPDKGYFLDLGQAIGAQASKYGFHTVSTCLHPLLSHKHPHTRHADEAKQDKRSLAAIIRLT